MSSDYREQARVLCDWWYFTVRHRDDVETRLTTALVAAHAAGLEAGAVIADTEFAKLYPGVDYGEMSDCAAYRIAVTIRTAAAREK